MTLSKARMTQYQKERRAKLKGRPPDVKVACMNCLILEARIKELESLMLVPVIQVAGPTESQKDEMPAELVYKILHVPPLTCAPAAKELAKKLGVAKDALDGKQSRPPYALCPKCHIMNERCMCK